VPANKNALSLTYWVLRDLLSFLSPFFSTVPPIIAIYREIGKTQPENLIFRHDYCWHRFNQKKEQALKNGVLGLYLGR